MRAPGCRRGGSGNSCSQAHCSTAVSSQRQQTLEGIRVEGMHFIVSGRVQGVFFRASAQERARALGLTGWVRNLADGRVELEAFGEADALAAMRDWLHEGPEGARVDRLEHEPCAVEQHAGFEIRA